MEAVGSIIRAAILDDEPLGRMRIRELLEAEDDVEVIAEYGDASTATAAIPACRPDLLVLDVQIARGSAFTILQSLKAGTAPATIFVTAHDGYALRAFEFQAVDYLLKPFDSDRFRQSVERARHRIASERLSNGRSPSPREPIRRLAVPCRDRIIVLRVDDIDWIETAGNYVRLHAGGQTHLYRDTLANFESRLDPQRFVRIHRATVVNVDRVTQLEPSFRREHLVTLRDGTRLTMSAPYRARLQAVVGRF